VIISSRLPKQLLLKSKNVWPSLYRSLGELKVDTLLVQTATFTSVALALDHAPHVHTLVLLSNFVSSSAARIPVYKNVTTLSVTSSSQLWLMTMFPNLAKLRIACIFNMKEHARLLKYIGTNLKELEIYPAETYPKNELQKIGAIPSLTKIYVQCRKTQRAVIDFNVEKFVFTDLFVANDKISSLPYHEYFNMTGKTKLAEMMQKGDVDRVTELLFTETTKEYEQDFQIRRINFKFPFLAMQFPTPAPPTSSKKLSGNVKSVLLANNYFSYWETFSCLVDLREYDKAIEHLQELPQNLPVPPNIPMAVLALLTEAHQTRIMSILEHNLGPEILKPLFAAKDEGGISLSHHLTVKVDRNNLMKYVDQKLLTGSGENLATVAFNNGKFARWLDCIVSGVDIQLQKYNVDRFKTLFNSASGENDLQMITEFLFNSGEDSGEPFIFTAIKYLPLTRRNEDKAINPVIEILLRCHGHADLYDKNGRSLLNALIRTASRLKCPISLLKKLLKEYNTDMNHVDKEGKTPLTTAIDMQDEKMTFNLLRSKAVKHDQPDGSGITPFMKFLSKAKTSDEFFYSTLLNFLDRGVDLNELDFDECGREMYPISIALQCGQSKDRIQSLVSRGCDLSLVDLDLNTVFHALLLCESDDYVMQMIPYLASRAPINAENSYGNSPIKIALLAGRREEIIQKLTENGAEISLYSALRVMTHPNQVKGLLVKSIDLTQIVPCIRHICQHWDPASVKNLLSGNKIFIFSSFN
jgi:ankyrin repeat protein